MALIHGTSGDDEIHGTPEDDTIDAGAGNDLIWGNGGTNTYLFNRGSGRDTLDYSPDVPIYELDTIKLGPGIAPSDVTLVQTGKYQYVLSIVGSSDSLTLQWEVYRDEDPAQIEFADGTLWTSMALNLTVPAGSSGADRIYGSGRDDVISGLDSNDRLLGQDGNDTLLGGAGNDFLIGDSFNQSGDDVLDGGAGNDTLWGDIGTDTYRFGRGYGNDTIFDGQVVTTGDSEEPSEEIFPGGVDRVEFLAGVNPGDVLVTRNGGNAVLTLAGTGDTLTIEDHFDFNPGWGVFFHKVESFHFADGTVWTDLESHMASSTPTPGNDVLTGTAGNDEIDGLAGNDTISGLGGNDHLIGSGGNDQLNGGAGADTLYGGLGNDVYDGGAGSDLMYSGAGQNTYLFGLGSGQDTISYEGDAETFGLDTIRLAPGLTPADVVLTQVSNLDYRLTLNGSTDSLLLSWYADRLNGPRAAQILFDDGTLWTDLPARLTPAPATAGNDRIYGSSRNDTLDGLAGNDALFGNHGNDTLIGGAGNDFLGGDLVRGFPGDDVLDGGADDDTLHGENGNDTYRFGLGYGHDTIFDAYQVTLSEGEQDYDDGGADRVEFLAGVNPGDVRVTREGDDAILTLVSTGDTLTIQDHFWEAFDGSGYHRMETFHFADGTVWIMLEEHMEGLPGPGDDSLVGTASGEIIHGLAGNDTIDGLGGNDELFGDPGDDVLLGGSGADTLDGGEGHDSLEGGGGNDVYRFRRFSGDDTIRDSGGSGDRIELDVFLPADITVTRHGNDAYLTIEDTLDQLRIEDYFTTAGKIESIRFENGTSWTSLTSRVKNQAPTDGNNTIYGSAEDDSIKGLGGNDGLYGFSGNDTLKGNAGRDTLVGGRGDDFLEGGDGSDRLEGGAGSDTYYLKRGDGEDTIWEEYGQPGEPAETEGTDVALFASDIRANQLWFARDGFNLEVTVIGSQTRFVIEDWYGAGGHIETFVSGDGKELDAGNVNNLVDAMAAFAPPAAWQSNLPPSYAAALNPVIAANWQS